MIWGRKVEATIKTYTLELLLVFLQGHLTIFAEQQIWLLLRQSGGRMDYIRTMDCIVPTLQTTEEPLITLNTLEVSTITE